MKNRTMPFLILSLATTVPALAQNIGYTDYFTYSTTYNSDGSATVTPTAEVTGTDDLSDWEENGYRPLCTLVPKIQLTGDSNWIPGPGVALGKTVDLIRTGQPIQVPADGSTVSLQYSAEVLAVCSGAGGYYEYPAVSALDSWSYIDPFGWLLMGFEPEQTSPPNYIQYCPDGDACAVGQWELPPRNFVDFADFANDSYSIHTTYWGPPPVTVNNTCVYTILACSTGTPQCKAPEGFQWYPSCPNYMKSLTLMVNGKCVLVSYNQPATGPGPCN